MALGLLSIQALPCSNITSSSSQITCRCRWVPDQRWLHAVSAAWACHTEFATHVTGLSHCLPPSLRLIGDLRASVPHTVTVFNGSCPRLYAPPRRVALACKPRTCASGTGGLQHCTLRGGRSSSTRQPMAASTTTTTSSSSAAASADTAPRCTPSNACASKPATLQKRVTWRRSLHDGWLSK